MSLKGVVDVNYEPRMTATKQRHGCLVTIDPATTARRLTLKARDLCSKGKSECRFSDARTKDQLAQLHALSPKVEQDTFLAELRKMGASSVDSQSMKPNSMMQMRVSPKSGRRSPAASRADIGSSQVRKMRN